MCKEIHNSTLEKSKGTGITINVSCQSDNTVQVNKTMSSYNSHKKGVALVLLSFVVGGTVTPVHATSVHTIPATNVIYQKGKNSSLKILKSGNDSYSSINTNMELFDMNDTKKKENLKRLAEISCLEYDWNCNEAEPFDMKLIEKCRYIINRISMQPDIFPTACDSIQLEYNFSDGRYLEFEVLDDQIEVYLIKKDGEEIEMVLEDEYMEEMNRLVEQFYEYRI